MTTAPAHQSWLPRTANVPCVDGIGPSASRQDQTYEADPVTMSPVRTTRSGERALAISPDFSIWLSLTHRPRWKSLRWTIRRPSNSSGNPVSVISVCVASMRRGPMNTPCPTAAVVSVAARPRKRRLVITWKDRNGASASRAFNDDAYRFWLPSSALAKRDGSCSIALQPTL